MALLDGADITELAKNLETAEQTLDRLSQDLPLATKSQKFAVSHEKVLAASFMVKYLKEGNKPALAEKLAWADPLFQEKRGELENLWLDAERTIQRHKQAYTHWDTARSLLGVAKVTYPAAYHGFKGQT